MIIKMLKTASSPKGTFFPGNIYNVDDEMGQQFLNGEAAIEIKLRSGATASPTIKDKIKAAKKALSEARKNKFNKKQLAPLEEDLEQLEAEKLATDG